jgi:hypothetical protein
MGKPEMNSKEIAGNPLTRIYITIAMMGVTVINIINVMSENPRRCW